MEASLIASALVRDRVKLLGFIWAIVRDVHVADGLGQEAAELDVSKSEKINYEEHLIRWARKTARFKSLEALREKHRHAQPLDNDVLDLLEAHWTAADTQNVDEDIDHLRACVKELTPRAGEIVSLRYLKGMSSAQVADALNVTVASVYVAVARVHRALKECIRRRRLQVEGAGG